MCLLVSVSVCAVTPCYAGPAKKLGRGLANTVTGWMEMFVTINEEYIKHSYAGGLIYGVPMGLARASVRTLVGVYETLTFFIPAPNNYEPILEPEFIPFFDREMDDMTTY